MALDPELVEQISAAMYGYAGASAAATTLTPFSAPTQNTNPAGTGTQAAAVASAGTGAPGALSQLLPQVPSTLQSLASGGTSRGMPNMLSNPLVTSRRSAPRVASQHDEEAKCRNHQRHPRRHPMSSKMLNQPW